jgi:hypothetical protein
VVLSRDQHDVEGVVEPKVVEEVFAGLAKVIQVHVGGQVISPTEAHPFWVQGKGWLPARELIAGDRLLGHDGQSAVVEKVVDPDQWVTVYNLRVADFHTYFVGCDEWGFSVWAHNTSTDLFKALVESNLDPKLTLGSRRFRAGSRNPSGIDGDLYALAQRHANSDTMPPSFATEIRQHFPNAKDPQIEGFWKALKAEPENGASTATRTGTRYHNDFVKADRASKKYDQVAQMIRTKTGEPIEVPYEVDLITGLPVNARKQAAFPDAVSFSQREIVDYKPVGRKLSKDRQEFIRNIRAFEIREGVLPDKIIVKRYDPATGKIVEETTHSPSEFLPKGK